MAIAIPNKADVNSGYESMAGLDSVDVAILAAATWQTGVVSGGGLTPMGGVGNELKLTVAAGVGIYRGRRVTWSAGNLTTTPDATNPRYAVVGVNTAGTLSITHGTAAAALSASTPGPVLPAVPGSTIPLYVVYIPANYAGPFVQANLDDGDRRIAMPELSVWDAGAWGLVGDNSTDNSTALQTMMDAISTTDPQGVTILWPNGVFKLVTNVALDGTTGNRRIFKWIGCGGVGFNEDPPHGTSFVTGTAGMTMLSYSPPGLEHSGPTFEGITFRNTAGGTSTLVYTKLVNRWTFRNCKFYGAGNGVAADIGLHIFSDVLAEGFSTSGGDNSWNMVDQCTFGNIGTGIKSEHSYGFTVLGGDFDNCATGINLMATPSGFGNQHARIIGVKMDTCPIGIDVRGRFHTIIGNALEACGSTAAIRLGEGAQTTKDNVVAFNMMSGGGTSDGRTAINIGTSGDSNFFEVNRIFNIQTQYVNNGVANTNWFVGKLPDTAVGIVFPDSVTLPSSGSIAGELLRVGSVLFLYDGSFWIPLAQTKANTAASSAIVSTATETAFDKTATLLANAFRAGKAMRVTARGVYGTHTTGTLTIRIRLRLQTGGSGGTFFADSGVFTLPASVSNRGWQYEVDLVCFTSGSSGTVESQGWVGFYSGTLPAVANTTTDCEATAAVTLNTTQSWVVAVMVTHGASQANNTITMRSLIVEELN